MYQTLWKNLKDNQINQANNLIKLILSLFCLVMTLICNNDKKNMITKFFFNAIRY